MPCFAVGACTAYSSGVWLVPMAFATGNSVLTTLALFGSIFVGIGAGLCCWLLGGWALRRRGVRPWQPPRRFDLVHTVLDFAGLPHSGIADCDGWPHAFVQQRNASQRWSEEYLLAPVDDDTLRLALEHGMLRERGEDGDQGRPALAADGDRYDQLTAQLAPAIAAAAAAAELRRRARFRGGGDHGLSVRALRVCWLAPRGTGALPQARPPE